MRCICIDVNECLRDCVDMCDHVNVCVYLYPRLWVLLIHAYLRVQESIRGHHEDARTPRHACNSCTPQPKRVREKTAHPHPHSPGRA